ncbi:hypothetical protein [Streptomyces pseudogriseolus]|uniref:hypothetical protein n=1 Tax=Streptomyces pseudogriseolus TaxID=36817 RepID=UPI003FA1ECDD
MARREKAAEASPEPSRAAGWFVLLALAAVAVAVVFALSTEAGILSLWAAGTAALWRAARRRKSPDLPLPSPTVAPSRGDVYAVETGRAREVRRTSTGGYRIFPEIEYVTDPDAGGEVNTP